MSEDKEEYEVGIPLEDLSANTPASDSNADEPPGQEDAPLADVEPPATPQEDMGVGLPSLFDEEELAEVGLKASPFSDEDGITPSDEAALENEDGALERPGTEAVAEPEDGAIAETADALPDVTLNGLEMNNNDGEDAEADVSPLDESLEGDEIPEQNDWVTDGEAALSQAPEDLRYRLNAIQDQLVQLQDEFTGKLKYDAHKDQIIDKLHQELQEYKQDIVKKHILSIVLDVVKVADDIRKWITYFRSLDVSQRDPVKLFRYLEAIPSDLEDIFYWQGVKPYASREGAFNPATQRAIKKIPTDDSTKDKTIAKSIRPGYEWEGKVIRQEMVAVYVYQDGNESVDTGNIDE